MQDQGGEGRPNSDSLAYAIKCALSAPPEDFSSEGEMEFENIPIKRKYDEVNDEASARNIVSSIPVGGLSNSLNSLSQTSTNLLNNEPANNLSQEGTGQQSLSRDIPYKPIFYDKCKDNLYFSNDYGPFVLYVEKNNGGSLQAMLIGKIIRTNNFELYTKISNIKKIGRNRIKIEMLTYDCANVLLKSPYWAQNNLLCYIPNFNIFRQGVIRDVECSLTEEEIKEDIISDCQVTQVRRIFKKDKDSIKKPTPVIIVTFRGQTLPSVVKLLGVICHVERYIQRLLQCLRCFKYGHLSSTCRSQVEFCEACGDNSHRASACNNSISCIFCKLGHRSTDARCPERIIQKKIKDLMSQENISHSEARNIICSPKKYLEKASNPPPNLNSQRLFPPMPSSPRPSTSANDLDSASIQVKRASKVMNEGVPKPKVRREDIGSRYRNFENISPPICPKEPVFNNENYNNNIKFNDIKEILIYIINKINGLGINFPNEEISSNVIDNLIRESFFNSAGSPEVGAARI